MTDRADVTLTARYELSEDATAADLTELLLTVPADARIGFMVPIRSVQSYADIEPPAAPRTLTATWTVPAGQPLTPPNAADDVPAAGWPVMELADRGVPAPAPLPPACPTCGRSGDDPCVGSLSGEALVVHHASRDRAEAAAARTHARGCTLDGDHGGPCKLPFAIGVHGADARLDAARADLAREKAAQQHTRRLNALDLGGTGL